MVLNGAQPATNISTAEHVLDQHLGDRLASHRAYLNTVGKSSGNPSVVLSWDGATRLLLLSAFVGKDKASSLQVFKCHSGT